ncbi:MAG: STAS domain-containing protein [Bacteroidota bacterium]
MNINLKHDAGFSILTLEGDFISEVEQMALRDKVGLLLEENKKQIIIDFSGVKYINSCGLGALVCVLSTVRKIGGDIQLVGIKKDVKRVMSLTKLDTVFNGYRSMKSALANRSTS